MEGGCLQILEDMETGRACSVSTAHGCVTHLVYIPGEREGIGVCSLYFQIQSKLGPEGSLTINPTDITARVLGILSLCLQKHIVEDVVHFIYSSLLIECLLCAKYCMCPVVDISVPSVGSPT